MEVIGSADGPTSIIVSQEVSSMSMSISIGIVVLAAVAVVVIGFIAWGFTRHGKE